MQMRLEQLSAHLAKAGEGDLKRLYTLHGDEALLAQEAADSLRIAARAAEYTERQVFTMSGARPDWDGLLAAGSAMSLFGDKQLIELRIPSGKPGKDGSVALQSYIAAAAGNPDLLTIVSLPRLDKTQTSSAWFGALEQTGVTLRCDSIERNALPLWIAQRLAAQGHQVEAGEAGQETLAFFADQVEGNLLAAHQEITKLGLIYQAGVLTLSNIEQAVVDVSRFDVNRLSDTVLSGHISRTLRMLDSLQAEGEAAVLVSWHLSNDIQALYSVRHAVDGGQPLAMALRQQRVWGARERLFERVVPHMQSNALARLLGAASTVDGIAKGLRHPQWPSDPWVALRRLAQSLCRACQSPHSSTNRAR